MRRCRRHVLRHKRRHERSAVGQHELELEHDLVVNALSTDIVTLGAGGGSVVWVSSTGEIRVGPESAGAQPGLLRARRRSADPHRRGPADGHWSTCATSTSPSTVPRATIEWWWSVTPCAIPRVYPWTPRRLHGCGPHVAPPDHSEREMISFMTSLAPA